MADEIRAVDETAGWVPGFLFPPVRTETRGVPRKELFLRSAPAHTHSHTHSRGHAFTHPGQSGDPKGQVQMKEVRLFTLALLTLPVPALAQTPAPTGTPIPEAFLE